MAELKISPSESLQITHDINGLTVPISWCDNGKYCAYLGNSLKMHVEVYSSVVIYVIYSNDSPENI